MNEIAKRIMQYMPEDFYLGDEREDTLSKSINGIEISFNVEYALNTPFDFYPRNLKALEKLLVLFRGYEKKFRDYHDKFSSKGGGWLRNIKNSIQKEVNVITEPEEIVMFRYELNDLEKFFKKGLKALQNKVVPSDSWKQQHKQCIELCNGVLTLIKRCKSFLEKN